MVTRKKTKESSENASIIEQNANRNQTLNNMRGRKPRN